MLLGHDNFQSYFLIVGISGTYRVVSLRQLRYLESLAETRHFGHAAEACAVSQHALSMQIKELEDELKVSLVERRKSGIEFTEQGEEMARRDSVYRALSVAYGAAGAAAALSRASTSAPRDADRQSRARAGDGRSRSH